MMPAPRRILRVAIQTPLRRLFDYLPPQNIDQKKLAPGQRLLVPFGKTSERVGLLTEITDKSGIEPARLKYALKILDEQPLLPPRHLRFMDWASRYYFHSPGDVLLGTLPAPLARGRPALLEKDYNWALTPAGKRQAREPAGRAVRQASLLHYLESFPRGISGDQIREKFAYPGKILKALVQKGFLTEIPPPDMTPGKAGRVESGITLNKAQMQAVDSIISAAGRYQAFLLFGVTGSGKTEVYLRCIRHVLQEGGQALILLPEIGLTPQFVERFTQQLNQGIAVIHSALPEGERRRAWLGARDGRVPVILGTRSAIWTPFKKLGIIIVDEEHDLSYKQQEGFRYSARDLALIRARNENVPVVLGSATPSMESLQNVATGKYRELKLARRAGAASLPEVHILDIRGSRMHGALSLHLLESIRHCVDKNQQVLLFLNRRGYAPVMICHDCGWLFRCPRCDIKMTYHKHAGKLCCHHCGHQETLPGSCPGCGGGTILEIGHGTQRLTETLAENFPGVNILRIDRDTTRRKGAMQSMLNHIQDGQVNILIGTQMLTKGHHFPKVTMVVIVDADRGLFSADFRASERMAQLIMQVSGRAGRAENPGRVIIQTHYPEHPLLRTLAVQDYGKIAGVILEERREAQLPPFSYHVLLRAEAHNRLEIEKFLGAARSGLPPAGNGEVMVFGPVPAPIEKRAGRYRMQLLLQSTARRRLRNVLDGWIERLEQLPGARKVRWSLDVDPQDML